MEPEFDSLICSALRGERPAWPDSFDVREQARFLAHCAHHGVDALLHLRSGELDWPESVISELRRHALGRAAWEARHRAAATKAVEALANAGIVPLIYKGSALAYTHYPSPHLRPRADTDILIAAAARETAANALAAAGFRQEGSVSSEFVTYEASFVLEEMNARHVIDLHWRIHYSQLQAKLLPYAELVARSIPLRALGEARAPTSPHALLLTCIHRSNDMNFPLWRGANAQFGSDRLVWLQDIDLLCRSMDESEIRALSNAAAAKGLLPLVTKAIAASMRCFGLQPTPAMAELLSSGSGSCRVERYQRSSTLAQKWQDFATLASARARLKYVSDHLSPPADYLRTRYPGSRAPAAVLQIRRLVDALHRV